MTLDTFLRRFGGYCIVGACAFVADFLVFLALVSSGTNPYVANVAGICVGITVSFTLNRRYNFRKLDVPARRAAKFIAVALLGMALSTLSMMLLLNWQVDVRIAKVVCMVFVFGLQFLLNTLFTFR